MLPPKTNFSVVYFIFIKTTNLDVSVLQNQFCKVKLDEKTVKTDAIDTTGYQKEVARFMLWGMCRKFFEFFICKSVNTKQEAPVLRSRN